MEIETGSPAGPRRLRGHRLRRYGICMAIAGTAMIALTFAADPSSTAIQGRSAGQPVSSAKPVESSDASAVDPQRGSFVSIGQPMGTMDLEPDAAAKPAAPATPTASLAVASPDAPFISTTHLLRGSAVAITLLGLLAHAIGIYRADRALTRRQRQQCENCGYDLRACSGTNRCPECGDCVRCLPSIRVK